MKAKLLKFLDVVAPGIAAKMVYSFMSNPRIRKLRASEEEVLEKSIQETITFKQFDIQLYKWGIENEKKIFLIHGWEGQAGNFAALVDLLLEKKYQIIAFDGP